MTEQPNQRQLSDTSTRFVVDWQVGAGTAPDGQQLVLLALGSLALGTEYAQAKGHEGEAEELLHFVMNADRAQRLAKALKSAAD